MCELTSIFKEDIEESTVQTGKLPSEESLEYSGNTE
jgi:hypothetical protein